MNTAPANIVSARVSAPTWRQRLRDYLVGAGSIVDIMPRDHALGATFYTDDEAAMAADWAVVCNDFQQAMTSAVADRAPNFGRADDVSIRTRTAALGKRIHRFRPASAV